tara:strand:- start:623 stop:1003 length:381 start_codon:yes stop_codon:yes gene_type:complete
MSQAHTFTASVKCDQGWSFNGAFVAIYDWSQSMQEAGSSSNCKDEETIETSIESIAFRAVFWPSIQNQVDKLKPRPLVDMDNVVNPHLLSVDLEHPSSIEIMNNNHMSSIDKKNRLIELEVKRRSA